MYFVDRAEVCRRKTNLELICSDGLGGNDHDLAYVISTKKQTQIFIDEKEAKVKYLRGKNAIFTFIIFGDKTLEMLVWKSKFKCSHVSTSYV